MSLTIAAPVVTRLKTASSSIHLDYFDGLRAVAALYVVVHHVQEQIGKQLNGPVFTAFTFFFKEGRYAVDLFIVISGFCLMLPVVANNGVLPKGTTDFLRHRAKRILPAYYLAMLFSLILIFTVIGNNTGYTWDVCIPVTDKDLVTHLLLVQDMFSDTMYKINHTFWSVSVEWHIYFLFPFLIFCWRTFGPAVTSVFSIVLSLALWYVLQRTNLNVYGMSPHYIALFTFGMLAAQLSRTGNLQLWKLVVVLLTVLAAIVVHPIILNDLVVGIISAGLMTALLKGKFKSVRQALSYKPLVFIGTFAYSIYLIHAPLIQVVWQYMIMPLNLSPLASLAFILLIGLPFIIGCSYLFYTVAERPFLKRIKTAQLKKQAV